MTTPDTKAIRENMKALDGATPGSWHANGPKKMELVGRVHRVLNPEDYPAAFVPAWDRPGAGEVDGTDEAIANARLIAAAPDMRETILALCDALDELRTENERLRAALGDVIDCDHHNFCDGGAPKYVRIARAALAQKGDHP